MKKIVKKIIFILFLSFLFLKSNSQARAGIGFSSSLDSKGIMDIVPEINYDFKNVSLETKIFIFSGPVYTGVSYTLKILDKKGGLKNGFNLGIYYKEMGRDLENYFTFGISWYHFENPLFIKVSVLDNRYLSLQLTLGRFLNLNPFHLKMKKENQLKCPY